MNNNVPVGGVSAPQTVRVLAPSLPAVCTEGGHMQIACRTQGAGRIVGPSVTYGYGEVYAFITYYHLILTHHFSLGNMPFAVGPCYDKARQIILRYQRLTSLWSAEVNMDSVIVCGEMVVDGCCVGYLTLTIGLIQCNSCHASTHFSLCLGVNIFGITQVYIDYHACVG